MNRFETVLVAKTIEVKTFIEKIKINFMGFSTSIINVPLKIRTNILLYFMRTYSQHPKVRLTFQGNAEK